MTLHQYTYILVIGSLFAFLDAWNIGANDVANSFATSVSSRSLTLIQAMSLASVMEFAGVMAVGNEVSETLRSKVINPALFKDDPAVLMLAMVCAVVASSIYLTIATRLGLPVSTTHSMIGALIGVGFATVGPKNINWGWGGVSQVFAAWLIAPTIAGAFGAIVFLISKYGIMNRERPVRKAMMSIPVYFFITSGLIVMLVVWKGAKSKVNLSDREITGAILGAGAGVALLSATQILPFAYRKVRFRDWQLKWYHVFFGPALLKRGPVPVPAPAGMENAGIPDYYPDHITLDQLERQRELQSGGVDEKKAEPAVVTGDVEQQQGTDLKESTSAHIETAVPSPPPPPPPPCRPAGKIYSFPVLFYYAKRFFLRGVSQDVISSQKTDKSFLTGDLEQTHARASRFDNDAEYLFSFLQILTAAAASFTHGANDISNAIGPYATIYQVWKTGSADYSAAPYWILAYGAVGLVLGLWLYGYRIMRNLGNRLTFMSPTRGFSMELGTAITLVFATKLKLPVSTTQCITGAIVGVGLCNGHWRAINWRMVGWIYFGWLITLPVTAVVSGCLMAIIVNAPRYGMS